MSSKLIQDGETDDLERELEYLKSLHKQEMDAAEASLDAEENKHIQRLSNKIDEDHTAGVKQKHRDLMKEVCILLKIRNIIT